MVIKSIAVLHNFLRMYDAIASDLSFENMLVKDGRQMLQKVEAEEVDNGKDLLESLRGSNLANSRRNALADALWRDYTRVLEERGMSVQVGDGPLCLDDEF